jgi:ankyrin repeat protein
LAHGVDANFDVGLNNTRLTRAAELGQIEAARLLLDKGADLEHRNIIGQTPLLIAAGHEMKMTLFLLERGADWKATDKRGKDLIDMCAEHHERIIISYQGKPAEGVWWEAYLDVVRWLAARDAPLPDRLKALVEKSAGSTNVESK